MANATNPLMGRSVGHDWADFMATSGHFCWPSMGSSQWPLTLLHEPPHPQHFRRRRCRPRNVGLVLRAGRCSEGVQLVGDGLIFKGVDKWVLIHPNCAVRPRSAAAWTQVHVYYRVMSFDIEPSKRQLLGSCR
jgi:hypothetical protein